MRTPAKRQKNYDKTLKWINKIRTTEFADPELDEILTGDIGRVLHCAVAHSIGHKCCVTGNNVGYYRGAGQEPYHRSFRMPRYVRQFIKDFDNYLYPELISPNLNYTAAPVGERVEEEQVVERV